MNRGGPTAREDAASTAEIEPIRAEADGHRVLDLKNRATDNRLPPPIDDEEFRRPSIGFWRRHSLFIATVVLPMAVAAGFLFLVITPRYSSTASFRVHSIQDSSNEFKTALSLV